MKRKLVVALDELRDEIESRLRNPKMNEAEDDSYKQQYRAVFTELSQELSKIDPGKTKVKVSDLMKVKQRLQSNFVQDAYMALSDLKDARKNDKLTFEVALIELKEEIERFVRPGNPPGLSTSQQYRQELYRQLHTEVKKIDPATTNLKTDDLKRAMMAIGGDFLEKALEGLKNAMQTKPSASAAETRRKVTPQESARNSLNKLKEHVKELELQLGKSDEKKSRLGQSGQMNDLSADHFQSLITLNEFVENVEKAMDKQAISKWNMGHVSKNLSTILTKLDYVMDQTKSSSYSPIEILPRAMDELKSEMKNVNRVLPKTEAKAVEKSNKSILPAKFQEFVDRKKQEKLEAKSANPPPAQKK